MKGRIGIKAANWYTGGSRTVGIFVVNDCMAFLFCQFFEPFRINKADIALTTNIDANLNGIVYEHARIKMTEIEVAKLFKFCP